MKRFSRVLSMLLAIVMVVGLLPLSIWAEDTKGTHTVQFKLNYNGAPTIATQTVADGACATQPDGVVRTGWNFQYWYIRTTDGNVKFDLATPVTEDLVLYARWDENVNYWGPIWDSSLRNVVDTPEEPDEEEPGDGTEDPDEKLTYEELLQKQEEELDAIAELNGGELPEMYLDEEDYIPSAIIGTYSDEIVTDYESAIKSLKDIQYLMGFDDVEEEFVGQKTFEFKDTKQYRLQQVYNEYVVYGKQLIVTTDEHGNITSLNGNYDPLQNTLNDEINVTSEVAYALISSQGYAETQNAELVVYTLDGYNEFAWLFSGSYTVLVSAVDGTVLLSFTNTATNFEQTIGRGEDENGNTVTFNTKYDTETERFYFHDLVRNVRYHDMDGADYTTHYEYEWETGWYVDGDKYYSHDLLDDDDNVWDTPEAIVLYQNISNTYDYYLNTIGLRSYDGKNGAIYAFVNDGMYGGEANAFSMGPSYDFEGDFDSCDNKTILAFSKEENYHRGLDTATHEFTHSLQHAHVPRIKYSGETGALMEAYSDISGELAQLYYNGTTDWIDYERNLADPTSVTNSSNDIIYPVQYMGVGYDTENMEVHHNSTIVSHVGYEIYTNGISDIPTLTELLFRAWNYLYSSANFLDYRCAMVSAAKAMDMTTEQISIITIAFDEANIIPEKDYKQFFDDSVELTILVSDSESNAIADVPISVYNGVGEVAQTYCDANGKCTLNLKPGNYDISINSWDDPIKNYKEEFIFDFVLNQSEVLNIVLSSTSEDTEDIKYEVGGNVTDALTGDALSDVTMYFRKGYNITSGRSVEILTTGADGKYYTDALESGYYTVELVKDGYIRSYIVVQSASTNWSDAIRNNALNQNISLSPYISTSDTIRIVLSWGENPADLDSHITGTLSDGNNFHVYFADKQAVDTDGTVVANLDIDDVTSYGPETTTLHWSEGVVYNFYVHLFSGSGTLSTSSANIKIYSGSALIQNIDVPSGSEGMRWWKVFTFEDGDFTIINTFSDMME